MTLEIVTIACLSDNYAFLAHCQETGNTSLVDIPEAGPILKVLEARNWSLDQVVITHHHDDHVQGLPAILEKHDAMVIGSQADAGRLPPLDRAVSEGDTVAFGAHDGNVIDVSGHTINHIAVHVPTAKVMFTADSLMALGCGRVFEGTYDQMWHSLQKLASLPVDTLVCSGHEYTAANGAFALTVDPDNPDLRTRVADIAEKRVKNLPTVPSLLSLELATNPFLRASDPGIRAHLQMHNAPDSEVFAEIRSRKDAF